jgi:putative FmdB family regulatory protein
MPTYEYECKSCGNAFDVFQSMSDDPLKVCPSCGNSVRRKINGGTGIIFKGSGFYKNDSRKSSSSSVSSSRSGGEAAREGGARESGTGEGARESAREGAAAKPECASCPASTGSSSESPAKKDAP